MEQLEQIRNLSKMAEFVFVRQKEQKGNGDAILTAKNVVGDEPFVVCWGDEILVSDPLKTKQLVAAYDKYQSVILGSVIMNSPGDGKKYGFAKGTSVEDGIMKVEELIEKPGDDNKPSDYASLGGFVFPPEIFAALEEAGAEVKDGEELVYIDGVNKLREQGKSAYSVEIKGGKYYDCGNVSQYLKTNVEMALKRPDINGDFSQFIKEIAGKL